MKSAASTIFLLFAIYGILAVPSSSSLKLEDGDYLIQSSHYPSNLSNITQRRVNYDDNRSADEYNQSRTGWKRNQKLLSREGPNMNYNNFTNGEPDESTKKKAASRNYGKGRVHSVKKGEMVMAPAANRRKNINKNTETPPGRAVSENEAKKDGPVPCTACPLHQTIYAVKEKTFAIVPDVCPNSMWSHLWGPRPGNTIEEGLHIIQGTLGSNRQFCQFQYQVLVHRCDPLQAYERDTIVQCTANELWGSKCNFSCGQGKVSVGPTLLECMEDQKWSSPVPRCRSKSLCPMPKVKSNSKVWCETANKTRIQEDFLPSGSNCRFFKNGKEMSLNCKNGTWRIVRKSRDNPQNKLKNKSENKNDNVCNPNPCKNGGTCLRSESNKKQPICMCRPQTQGPQCEMRQCDYNICQNDGVCFFQNGERTCYCSNEYGGAQCQNYIGH